MNPTAIILICSVLLFAVNDSSGQADRGWKGAIRDIHAFLQAGNLQEEEWMEDLKYEDPLLLKAFHTGLSNKTQPGNSIHPLSDPVTIGISGLDPVFLDRPPPHWQMD